MNADAGIALLERLNRSDLYNDFKQAFEASTGLPLRLRPRECRQLPHRGQPHERPFCALISQTNRGCASYLERIVTAHGGWIRVRSTPGQGAEFFFELPQTARSAGLSGLPSGQG